jgi:hypothetical protein
MPIVSGYVTAQDRRDGDEGIRQMPAATIGVFIARLRELLVVQALEHCSGPPRSEYS